MARLPSRLRRLDGILADLPLDDPMLVSELDGYLTAVAVCPVAIDPAIWMPPIWEGGDGVPPPFDDPADVRLLQDMILARHRDILRDLGRGKLRPIFDVDERNGEVLWEIWIGGFATAMTVRPDAWDVPAGDDPTNGDDALFALRTLVDVACDAASLSSEEINALCDTAPAAIVAHVQRLHAGRGGAVAPPSPPARAVRVGRNDPCPCGSGRKFKQCCGRNG